MENEYEIDGFDTQQEGESSIAPKHPPEKAQKQSPFVDSPYECAAETEPEELPQEPAEYVAWHAQSADVPQKKKGNKHGKRVLAAVLVLALLLGTCGATALTVRDIYTDRLEDVYEELSQLKEQIKKYSYVANGNSVSGTPNTSTEGMTPAQVYAKNVDSVVAITCTVLQNSYGQIVQGTSSGSGFIISENGYIITNHHVIDDAKTIKVTTYGDEEYTAELVGSDDANDVALLKINATGLPVAKLGSSDSLIVGDQVVAIGNALGELTATLTVGYISGKDRTVTTDGTVINMLQTDAAINSGNSGGPLFNMKGEVVGITTAKYSGTSGSGASIEGICFAIPIDDVRDIVEELQEKGYVSTAYLNVMVSDSSDGIGTKVESVNEGGAAHRAGVRAGDYILALGEHEVKSVAELTKALRHFDPGDTTTITVFRGLQVLTLDITLDEKPIADKETSADNQQDDDDWFDFFG